MGNAKSWFSAKASNDGKTGDVSIYSEIGGWGITANDFRASLKGLGKVDTLNIAISSDGGDVTVGFAIFDILANHPADKIVTVQGLAASMASVIAMAGDTVVMPKNAMLMIHNPWGGVTGESDQIISFGEALAKMRDNIAQAYVDRSGQDMKDVLAMMDRETWLTAAEAVELGFADRVTDAATAKAQFNVSKFHNVPAAFGRTLKESTMTTKDKNANTNTNDESAEHGGPNAEEIRAELLASQKEIRSLCSLAGKADLAEGFINDNKSVSEVIVALDAAAKKDAEKKGKDGKGDDVSAHNSGNARTEGVKEIDPAAIFSRWNSARRRDPAAQK